MVDEAQLGRSTRVARPMSPRVAWAFLNLLDGGQTAGVSQPERSRLGRKRELLRESDAPVLLSSWLRNRATIARYSAAAADLDGLVEDFLLSEKGRPNVLLHVLTAPVLEEPVPLPVLLADLADHDGPRESAAVERLLADLPTRSAGLPLAGRSPSLCTSGPPDLKT